MTGQRAARPAEGRPEAAFVPTWEAPAGSAPGGGPARGRADGPASGVDQGRSDSGGRRPPSRSGLVVLALLGVAVIGAVAVLVGGLLGGDDAIVIEGTDAAPLPVVAEGDVHLGQIRVSEGVVVAAGYLSVVAGPGGDTLLGASSPAAEQVVLHQMDPDGSMGSLEEVPVPDDAELLLVPGSLHLMLEDLHEPLEPGATVELTLVFERAGAVTTTAPVLPYTRVIDVPAGAG